MKTRNFVIKDLNCIVTIELASKKEIFDCLDDFIFFLKNESNFKGDGEIFAILYNNGIYDYIDNEYDYHKIKKKNILSMSYHNGYTIMIYNNFKIDSYGNVEISDVEKLEM